MIVDAGVLLYAVRGDSPHHTAARTWLETAINDGLRVGLPAQSITAFLRILTNLRATNPPVDISTAWNLVREWLDQPNVWVPPIGEQTVRLLGALIEKHRLSGNLVMDAQIAALAVENGVAIVSFDSDFLMFDVPVINPMRP